MGFLRSTLLAALTLGSACEGLTVPGAASTVHKRATPYWYENIAKQGIAPFAQSGYSVYRNVKDFGAKGDGVTDDTAAINNAILSGGRCGRLCAGSTRTPATVYFPAGTYLVSTSILDQYYTNLVGDPNNLPVIKGTPNFDGNGLIDSDKFYGDNNPTIPNWPSTTVFYRQIRNFVFDLTAIPAGNEQRGIHWPTAQATSLQNLVFKLSTAPGTRHKGLTGADGSAGFMTDLTFNGGDVCLDMGNQQFTMRNLVFNNCKTALRSGFDWEWLYQGITINNCQVGLDISSTGYVSVTMIDSTISNTPVGILTSYNPSALVPAAGSIILENINLANVGAAVKHTDGSTILGGGTTTIAAWGQGHSYSPTSGGPANLQGSFTPNVRPASLLNGTNYYTRSKPQYETLPVSAFTSVRSAGARGDAATDDTAALQNVLNSATAAGKIVYFDDGVYRVTKTITIPPGAKIVGETWPLILSSGSFFNDMDNPKPVVQVGTPGQTGQVEWSNMIVGSQGTQAGAILIEWNLASSGTPSGMWDVHTRIGGFEGSKLQGECPVTRSSTNVNRACIGAYSSMHITASASGLYMENNWLWVADHDIENTSGGQITIFAGRGLLVDNTAGPLWLVGTSVEHHVLYQYQFVNAQNAFMGVIQTETPYYQPNPPAPAPFKVNAALQDPDFAVSCAGKSNKCAEAWGLRIVSSKDIFVYAAGLYSFFINNDPNSNCVGGGGPGVAINTCQDNILSLEGALTNINVYNLGTVGIINMITLAGNSIAKAVDNLASFPAVVALFRVASANGGGGGPSTTKPPTSTTTTVGTKTTITTSATATTSPPGPAPTGWNFRGCYTDNVAGRALIGEPVPGGAGALTVEVCQQVCKDLSYTIAGVEYSGECFCGNSLAGSNTIAPDGSAGCFMKCNGNSAQFCGGPNRLDLYTYGKGNGTAI